MFFLSTTPQSNATNITSQLHRIMLKFIQKLLGASAKEPLGPAQSIELQPEILPSKLVAPGAAVFDVQIHMPELNGFPVPDWDAVTQWVASIPEESDQADGWDRCELAWMQRLQAALGPNYSIRTADDVALLSTLDDVVASATLAHVSRSRQRVLHTLKGIAELPGEGYDILVVFDDHDTYYRYASNHYPDEGEFALSSGMYLNHGCGHFIMVKDALLAIEPIIVHELTHSCLSHLPIPLWLNEGLAVNTEDRFYPNAHGAHRGGHDAMLQHRRHKAFWGTQEIQQFWSGDSFARTDEGRDLSYHLASILTAQLAADWASFASFANGANQEDGGAQAAQAHLGLSLGRVVCALLERELEEAFEPNAGAWQAGQEPLRSDLS